MGAACTTTNVNLTYDPPRDNWKLSLWARLARSDRLGKLHCPMHHLFHVRGGQRLSATSDVDKDSLRPACDLREPLRNA